MPRDTARDPRYDILFEPVKIGPVTARNRFYQVPHCNGMGRNYPSAMAEMRRIKAEGGWAVVNTEEAEIHPSGDHSPWNGGRIWDDRDLPYLSRMVEGIHEHGSLAGIQLNHAGLMAANRFSRLPPMAPSHQPVASLDPVQARAMDRQDIRDLRRWYVNGARRARDAGFDIIYVYAGHRLTTLSHFLSRDWNQRMDEYGGSLENRIRLLREVMEETKEAVGGTCGIAFRFSVDELRGAIGMQSGGEGRDVVEMLAEIPDLWDVNIADWENDSATSRFKQTGYQDEYVSFVKSITTKPVVGVGRYTSPDQMVSLIKNGHLDFIGAARPSIADPFLPKKVEEGRIEDIRECIGCNICVASDSTFQPLRCTQNPTMGEEWRSGWHPERIAPRAADESVLIIGAGPAGLEAARALGQRGYDVTVAEQSDRIGGRVADERGLPGLAEWGRVADYREYQISQMPNVNLYLNSPMSAETVAEFEADHIALATGAAWDRTGRGRANPLGIETAGAASVLTPDDIFKGMIPEGPVVIFDDDHFYMGGSIAEKLLAACLDVTFVTPAASVSAWTEYTLEQHKIQAKLIEMGARIVLSHNIARINEGHVIAECGYTGAETQIDCAHTLLVTMRQPDSTLADALQAAGISATKIGDALAPSTIAAAVHAGHRYARDLGVDRGDAVPFDRELTELSDTKRHIPEL
ncbi:NAD(P)-binding protein [Roseovarius sp. LXJ103]|uniref:oxidoreductase n=1 Tax=Roseovarius carneus TaxID=2853164 RepID=UPI000D61DE43|nr:NAD(P)-binding protein [Roseovarius carneus]MBZ8117635.1 NAD(P)-binding protein [Roseovarius carneus]PWE36581.1 NADH:flavin oxidoreductase [Pelagicola sp. LXJ1103]